VTNPSGFPRLKMTMTYEPGLAVQLSSFAAKVLSQSSVLLEWSTLSEINNYGFYVQRRTVTDRDFVELPNTFVPGHGTTNVPQLYSFTDNTVTLGTWLYCLRQVDLDGSAHFTEPVQVSVLTRVKETAPNAFVLHQNYPNPFNPSTTIKYELPRASHVRLSVFSTLGREVATLVDEAQEPGYRSVQFDGSHLSSAVYLYRLEAGDFVATKRLLLLR
jgi:hypothetical protein